MTHESLRRQLAAMGIPDSVMTDDTTKAGRPLIVLRNDTATATFAGFGAHETRREINSRTNYLKRKFSEWGQK